MKLNVKNIKTCGREYVYIIQEFMKVNNLKSEKQVLLKVNDGFVKIILTHEYKSNQSAEYSIFKRTVTIRLAEYSVFNRIISIRLAEYLVFGENCHSIFCHPYFLSVALIRVPL